MNWEKFFGTALFERLKKFCADRNMSIASAIRTAVAEYLDRKV